MVEEHFKCRWAFLSCSSIASVFLPDILLPRSDSEAVSHEIVAVSTTGSQSRVQKWLEEHKVPNSSSVMIYSSWEEMLQQGNFDVVYISTPHPLHYSHALAAIQNKRNVLVEKPATINLKQFQILCAEAKRQNVVLMEAMWTRYLPAAQYLKNELLPKIGKVKRVYTEFSFPIWSPDLNNSSRFLDKEAGAGALIDQGVYALTWADIALNGICADNLVKVVHANSLPIMVEEDEVDDINTIILSKTDINSGRQTAVGIVTTSMTLAGSNKPSFYHRFQSKKAAPSVRIEGELASVAIPFPPIRPQRLDVQWYGRQFLDNEGFEKNDVIEMPVARGWGIWYQADVIAKKIVERRQNGEKVGEVIGEEESSRVLGWMDEARARSGIVYNPRLERT